VGKFAIVGLSKSRENRTFSGLALDDNLTKHKIEQRCGLYVIDLETGDIVHWARIEGIITELYDVVVLPGRKNTAAIGFRSDAAMVLVGKVRLRLRRPLTKGCERRKLRNQTGGANVGRIQKIHNARKRR
jgi:hypothetical protein